SPWRSVYMLSTSTTATRGPNSGAPPAPSPLRAPPTIITNSPATASHTRTVAATIVSRRPTLVLVVVVVVARLALTAPAAAAAALLAEVGRRHCVRQLLQAEADAALVGIHANDQQRQLVAHVDNLARCRHRPVGHLGG